MAGTLKEQMEKVRRSIAGLEAQRGTLGEEIIAPALESLRQQLASLEEESAKQAAPSEERRLVTILFIDMVGSTSRAEQLDPEEWRQLVQKFHTALGSAVVAHRGEVAQYLGDGLLAFFGAKEADEADPENAIRAALDAQAAVAALPGGDEVQARAGIHTGLVVVGELGEASHKEFTASGDAMNLAARLESSAPAGGILISHDTYRYVRGVFDVTPRPPLALKGKSEPLQTYLVRRAKPRPFRTVTRGVAGVETRTIGREAEAQALQSACLRAYEGHGTVWAQLVSQPGVGKSRLMDDLSDWTELREETYRVLRARAFSDDINQPFALIRRMWFDRFQISEDAPLAQAEAKWVARFRELSGDQGGEEAAHALGLLVGLPFMESPHIKAMRKDPTQVKGRAIVVSRDLLGAIRRVDPILVFLEDMQWIDSASWEYLMEVFLPDSDPEHANGMLVLGAARPEWNPPAELQTLLGAPGEGQDAHGDPGLMINLLPLSEDCTRELARELLQRVPEIPDQVMELLVERSEGVPYFAEEMVNWLIDHQILDTRGDEWRFHLDKLREEPLPATLQHLLLTRLSSLSQPERSALQRGAIFGRRFWTGGIEALGVRSGAEVLGHLRPRGLVEEQPESAFEGDTEWSFQQSLLREVTYESVLKRERASLHKVAAGWLEKQAREAGRLEEFAGLLGDHLERAGDLAGAADRYLMAGQRAMAQGAVPEARVFYTRALDLLPPIDREKRWAVLIGREAVLNVLGDSEARKADVAAMLELAHAIGDDNLLAEGYFRQAVYGVQTADMDLADRGSLASLEAARRCGSEALEAKALVIAASAALGREDFDKSRKDVRRAVELARHTGDESVLAFVVGRAAYCCAEMGDFTEGDLYSREEIELNHRLGDRAAESIALGNRGANYWWLGLYKEARTMVERALAICEQLGFRRAQTYDLLNLAGISRETGDLRKARQLAEQGLQLSLPTQDARGQSALLIELGLTQLAMGDAVGARRRFGEGKELAGAHGLPSLEAECMAGLAACAVMRGQLDEAETYGREAWSYFKSHGWTGISQPGLAYLECAEAFDALGDEASLQEVLEIGHKNFVHVVATMPEGAWRKTFLEDVPQNRAFMQMWETRARQPAA